MAGGAVWITLLKNFYDRARPTEVAHLMEESTKSFPSGHASIASTLYLTLGLLLAQLSHTRRFKVFFLSAAIMLTLLVGITRLALGVHYPTDVLGGWLLGGAWALGVWTLTHLIERRLDRADAASQRAVEAASRKHGGGGHEDLGAVEMHRT
jgi:undecaprenyl-diphosphatase